MTAGGAPAREKAGDAKLAAAARTATVVLLVAMLAPAAIALRDELSVWRMREVQRAQEATRLTAVLAPWDGSDADRIPPRAAMIRALVEARLAFAADTPARRSILIANAHQYLDRALAARPRWGEARVVQTYLAFVDKGPGSPEAHDAFGRSYIADAFLPQSGSWRVRFGIDQWGRIDAVLRNRVVEEAAWLASLSPANEAAILEAVRPNPEAMRALREARQSYAALFSEPS